MALIPLFDRHPERRHRLVTALGVVFFVGFAILWLVGHQLRFSGPDVGAPPPTETVEPAESGAE
jgi:hypothetical protein